MKCIETLARVNVLCVDKTGTITENTMEVQDVIPTKEYEEGELRPLSELLGDFTAAQSSDNITMEAMKRYFKIASGKKAVAKTGFSSASKYSSVTFEEASYVLGAPEFVLKEQYEIMRKQSVHMRPKEPAFWYLEQQKKNRMGSL